MINVNKIHIFIIENLNVEYTLDLHLFDYFQFEYGIFSGLAVDSSRLREELDVYNYSSTVLIDYHKIIESYEKQLTPLLEYCGIVYTIDDILDTILDEKLDDNRRIYLESVLYFKSNQKGKTLNNLNLKIRHFDDFCHQFSEDIVSHEIILNNKDFSETRVIIETYLTEKEANTKFINYLIK